MHRRIWHLLYQMFCYLHLLSAVTYISFAYFKYSTDTNAAPYTPIKQTLPKVSLCFDLYTILFDNITFSFFDTEYPAHVALTTGEIFALSPPASKLLKRCSYRIFEIDTFWSNINATECTNLFNITRYRMLSYICYKLQFVNFTREYSFYLTTHSIFDQRRLFFFVLNKPFNAGHAIFPILHFNDDPYYERIFDQDIVPSLAHGMSYVLSYHLYEITRLQAPYNTKCTPGMPKYQCYSLCRDEGFAKFNLTSHYSLLQEKTAPKEFRIAYFDNDSSMAQKLNKLKDDCRRKCPHEECEQNVAITSIGPPSIATGTHFIVETAKFPTTKVVHVANFLFDEYLLQCFSWAGICIGFSVLNTLFDKLLLLMKRSGRKLEDLERKTLQIGMRVNRLATSLHKRGYNKNSNKIIVKNNLTSVTRKKKRLLLLSAAYTVLTLVSLLWQLVNVAENYFLFQVTWKFTYETNYRLQLPNTVICSSLDEVFHSKADISLNRSNFHEILTERDNHLMNFTIKNILHDSLNEEILFKCRTRNWTDPHFTMDIHDRKECFEYFRLVKIVSMEKLCFIFQPRQPSDDLDFRHLTLVPGNRGIMYSLVPNDDINTYPTNELIVYFGQDVPYLSKEHAVITLSTQSRRMQLLSFNLFDVELLPPPFSTQCIPKSMLNRCKYDCYFEAVSRINRLSHGETFDKPLPFTILTYTDLTNQSFNSYWLQLEDKCYKGCLRDLCYFNYTITSISHAMDRSEYQLELVITASRNPKTCQTAVARVTFYDFYYQVLCCFSFWIGFSFVSRNSFKNKFVQKSRTGEQLAKQQLLTYLNRINHLFPFFSEQRMLLRQFKRRYYKTKLTSASSQLLCLLGCIFHLSRSFDYFGYPIILDTMSSLETQTSYALTICFNGYHYFAEKASIKTSFYRKAHEFQLLRSNLLNMTIEEMFKQTPPEDNLIVSCRFWGLYDEGRKENSFLLASDRLMLWEKNSSRCHRFFKAQKFFMQTKICYSFTPRVKLNWNRDQMFNTFGYQKHLFMIALDSSLITERYSVVVTPENAFHGHSAIWSPNVRESRQTNKWHIVSYSRYVQNILAPPYSDGGFTHMLHVKCIDLCINDRMHLYNKSLTSIFFYPSKRTFFTYADRVKAPKVNKWVNERLEECERGCRHTGAKDSQGKQLEFTVTSITEGRHPQSSATRRRGPFITSFYLRSTDDTVTEIMFKPQISLFQFFITIGSIVSIWFGLSFISMSPYILTKRKRSTGDILLELQLKSNVLEQLATNKLQK